MNPYRAVKTCIITEQRDDYIYARADKWRTKVAVENPTFEEEGTYERHKRAAKKLCDRIGWKYEGEDWRMGFIKPGMYCHVI